MEEEEEELNYFPAWLEQERQYILIA